MPHRAKTKKASSKSVKPKTVKPKTAKTATTAKATGAAKPAEATKKTVAAPKRSAVKTVKTVSAAVVSPIVMLGESATDLAEIERKIAAHEREATLRRRSSDTSDVDSARMHGLAAARLVLEAEGPPEEVRAWLHRAVTGALRDLERARYRVIGPRWQLEDYELLGAACLVGRGPELVRAMAHFHSLGEARATPVWRAFLGRQGVTAREGGKSAGDDADALVSAGAQGLARAIEKFLSGTWANHARGLVGSRASFLATGLCAFWNVRPALPATLERYVASSLFEPPKLAAAPQPRPTLPRAPDQQAIAGAPRDASRSASEHANVMNSIAAWVYESLALAKNERAGEYLVSVPEACVDVALSAYAAGAECNDVGAWLAFAVELQVARIAARVPGDRINWFDDHRELAGAAILTGREKLLADAWRTAPDLAADALAAEAIQELGSWLTGERLTSVASTKDALRRATSSVIHENDASSIAAFVRTPDALPSRERAPWPGPFSAFVTAACKRARQVPPEAERVVMRELLRAP